MSKSEPSSQTVFSKPITLLTLGGLFAVNAVSIDGPIVAIPDIALSFGVPPGAAQLTTVMFLLGYALAHIPVGLLGDRYGRRPIILIGLLIAIVASIAAVAAPNFETLLIARFIQGVATCFAGLLARAMIRDVASGRQASEIASNALSFLTILIVIAPLLSGLLLYLGSWRYVLALVSVYLVGIFLLTLRLIPETMATDKHDEHPWSQFTYSLKAFLSSRQSLIVSALSGIGFGTYFILATVGASFFEDVYGLSGWVFGIVFSAAAVVQFFATRLNAKQVRVRGSHFMLRCAAGFTVFGVAICLLCSALGIAPIWLVILAALSFAITHGIIFPNSIALVLDPLPKTAGFAAAIHGTFQAGVASIVGFVASSFYDQTIETVLLLFAGFGSLTLLMFLVGRAMLIRDHLAA